MNNLTTNVVGSILVALALASFMFVFIFCVAIIAYMPLLTLAIFFIVLSYFTGRDIRKHRP